MKSKTVVYVLAVIVLSIVGASSLALSGMAKAGPPAQGNATEQLQTIDAVVNQRLTQTAQVQQQLDMTKTADAAFLLRVTATAAFNATVDARLLERQATLTAAAQTPDSKSRPLKNPCTGEPFRTVMTGAGLSDAQARLGGQAQNRYVVTFQLNTNSSEAKNFANHTKANIGQILAIVLDGQVISTPTIQAALTDGGEITGNFTLERAKTIALWLRTSALPGPLNVVATETTSQGVRLLLEANSGISADVMDEFKQVIERRLKALGFTNSTVQLAANSRIIVEVVSVDDIQSLAQSLSQMGLLEFVDFGRVGGCTASMPQEGQYVLTDRQVQIGYMPK